jgi:hypothetical protein
VAWRRQRWRSRHEFGLVCEGRQQGRGGTSICRSVPQRQAKQREGSENNSASSELFRNVRTCSSSPVGHLPAMRFHSIQTRSSQTSTPPAVANPPSSRILHRQKTTCREATKFERAEPQCRRHIFQAHSWQASTYQWLTRNPGRARASSAGSQDNM